MEAGPPFTRRLAAPWLAYRQQQPDAEHRAVRRRLAAGECELPGAREETARGAGAAYSGFRAVPRERVLTGRLCALWERQALILVRRMGHETHMVGTRLFESTAQAVVITDPYDASVRCDRGQKG